MFSVGSNGPEVYLTNKQERFVQDVYKKIVAERESTWEEDLSPEEVEEAKAKTLRRLRKLVIKYDQELQGRSRLSGILKRRYGQELAQMIEELQLGKVTPKEYLNLIIKLESHSAIPQEEVKADLMKWVKRSDKYMREQLEEAEQQLIKIREQRQVAEQCETESEVARQEEARARQAAEQKALEALAGQEALKKQLEEMQALLDKQQAQWSPDANADKKALLGHSLELSTSDPKRIKVDEKAEKVAHDAKPDEVLDKTKKPDLI